MSTYDPYANRVVTKPLSFLEALFSVLKVVIGTGIFSFPMAFKYVGLIAGIILTIAMTFVLVYGIHLLVNCMVLASTRNRVGYMSFPETMVYALEEGPRWTRCFANISGHFVDFILVLAHYGINVVYHVFAAANLNQFLDYHGAKMNVRVIIALLGLAILPFFLLRELKYLVPLNVIATILDLAGLVGLLWYIFDGLGPITDRRMFPASANEIPLMIGIVMFSISSTGGQLAVESKMEEPADYLGWGGVLYSAAMLFGFITIFLGFFGYWRYGDRVADSITLNVPTHEVLAQTIKLTITLAVFLSYPLCGYVPIDIIMNHYILNQDEEVKNPHMWEYIVRTIYVIVSTINGILLPKLGPLLGLVGTFSVSLLNVVFPCFLELCLLFNDSYGRLKWILWKDILMMLFGMLIFFYGSFRAVMEIINEYS